jgi:hypothetical protein
MPHVGEGKVEISRATSSSSASPGFRELCLLFLSGCFGEEEDDEDEDDD